MKYEAPPAHATATFIKSPSNNAGLPDSVAPYTLRHSGLSWALASGIPATDVACFGGTSLAMLVRTYAHLLTSSAESARARMDEFMADAGGAAEQGSQ